MNTSITKFNLCVASTFILGCSSSVESVKQPNFLFIITDDQDAATLDVYGDKTCDTPNLDWLAQSGIALTGAHQMGSFTGAVSTASRSMIMTGRNVWNVMAIRENMNEYETDHGNADIVDPSSPEYYSLPAIFHRAGYETYRTCKAGNSYAPANALFDERDDRTCRWDDDNEKGSQWHADNAIRYIEHRESRAEKKPFLLYLGFTHPHDPRNGRSDLLEKYGATNNDLTTEINDKMPPLPINWLPEKVFDNGDPGLRDECRVQGVMTRRDEATIRNERGREHACIEWIDTQIGRVLTALESTGELDNTYIIFTSDHGISVGKHAYMGKQNLYEHTFRVPFLVKGPGIKANSKGVGNVYLMDVLPTLCDLANINPETEFDGKSFKSVLFDEQETIRETLYGTYTGGTKPGIRCVKNGDWKLVKYDVLDGSVRETQLFNLKDNPNELTIEHHAADIISATGNTPEKNQIDLAKNPRYADKLAEMEALLLSQMEQVGDPYRLWNQR